jgi:hypothetical protein
VASDGKIRTEFDENRSLEVNVEEGERERVATAVSLPFSFQEGR